MGSRNRFIEKDTVYNGVSRVDDQKFMFKPNHNQEEPLLSSECSKRSLDLDNDLLPIPSIINIIGSSIGRAMELNPIQLHWFDGNINHNHLGFSLSKDQLENISPFLQHMNSLIARNINKLLDKTGRTFSDPCRIEACLDDDAIVQKLKYAVGNCVKDNQSITVEDSPYISSYKYLATGEPVKFWYIDWETFGKKGGHKNKKHHPKDYLKWTSFELTPIPPWQNLSKKQQQNQFKSMVKDINQEFMIERLKENSDVISFIKLKNTNPYCKPKIRKNSGPQPLCHATDDSLRQEYKTKWQTFMSKYREASYQYRAGDYTVEFPHGSYLPPITTIYTSSHL